MTAAASSSVSGNTAANLPSQETATKLSSEDAESAKKVHEEAQKWLRLKNFVLIGNTTQASGKQCEVWDRRNLGNIDTPADLDLNRKYVARIQKDAPHSVKIDTTIYGGTKDGAPRIILKAYIILS